MSNRAGRFDASAPWAATGSLAVGLALSPVPPLRVPQTAYERASMPAFGSLPG